MKGETDFAVSANEFVSTAAKALVAAGVERESAREAAGAAAFIAKAGGNGLSELLTALQDLGSSETCPLVTGPSNVDMLEVEGALDLHNTVCTALIYAMAALRRPDAGLECRVGNVAVDRHHLKEVPWPSGSVSLRYRETGGAGDVESRKALIVDRHQWEQIESLARKLLVPAGDDNRADAGAGTTDND